MSPAPSGLLSNIDELRTAFDASFARPATRSDERVETFLAVRCAGRALALRVAELSRLEPRRPIVPLPVTKGDLLGIAGIQGRLAPVYSLASLLGLDGDDGGWRWIAVCGLPDPVGFVFGALDAHFSVPTADIIDLEPGRTQSAQFRHAVRCAGELRSVVPLQSIQATVRKTPVAGRSISQESSSWAKD